jgi:branched-subunit amino acid transport protein
VSEAWVTILALAVVTAAIKASGPIVLGGRELPPWVRRLIGLLAPALLAAFVVVETFGKHKDLVLDARAAGLAAAAVALAARLSVLWAVGVAAVATALTRAVS